METSQEYRRYSLVFDNENLYFLFSVIALKYLSENSTILRTCFEAKILFPKSISFSKKACHILALH